MVNINTKKILKPGGGLIPQKLQDGFMVLTKPLIKILISFNVSPNAVTVCGFIVTASAAVAFFLGKIRVAGLLVLLGGLCDLVDGSLARQNNRATRFGALFDSTVDRYAELIMFFGIAAHFVLDNDYWSAVAVFFAICGSLMVSYTRARAEGLGFQADIGVMQRAERILVISIGACIHPIALKISLWLVALLANYTAVQRILYVYKQDLEKSKE
ncbi:MAG: CDP-alcohol phosphatidyltransferase family protein [Desulfobacterales bacterium]|jgi:CDP-diacylglycerol--glycerol-3-phosphate 3-phosphatidyltransferase